MEWLEHLKAMKAASKMTTKEIADQSGVPEPTLEKLFSGQTKDPKLTTIRSVVHCLGYTLDALSSPETQEIPSEPVLADPEGIPETIQILTNLFIEMGFMEPGGDISDADLEFCEGLVSLIAAYFNKGNKS